MIGPTVVALFLALAATFVGAVAVFCVDRHWPWHAARDPKRPLAGLVVVAGVLVGVWPCLPTFPLLCVMGGGWVVFLGLLDDRFQLSPRRKLVGQCIAAALAAAGVSTHLPSVWGETIFLTATQGVVAFLWTLGVMNAVNLIDGLDGLVVAILSSPLAVLIVVALSMGNDKGAVAAAAMLGTLTGFYPFNRLRGRLLLGDTGAEFLGYVFSLLLLLLLRPGIKGWGILSPLFFVAVPMSDTIFAVVRRVVRGRSIFQRDEGHIHHRLAARFGARNAVLALAFISLLFAGGGFLLWRAGS